MKYTDILILGCMNVQCPVVQFKGVQIMPLNSCPVCLNPGYTVSQPTSTVTLVKK